MALFLGASVITCLELLDMISRRCISACTRHRPTQHRKHCRRKSNPQHAADANHVHFRSLDDVTADTFPVRHAEANRNHFRSVDDVTTDTLPVANHNDARRGVLKSPSPLQTSSVAPCSGRLVNPNTQRASLNNRNVVRSPPLAETDI